LHFGGLGGLVCGCGCGWIRLCADVAADHTGANAMKAAIRFDAALAAKIDADATAKLVGAQAKLSP
jgi:hypothetical protein